MKKIAISLLTIILIAFLGVAGYLVYKEWPLFEEDKIADDTEVPTVSTEIKTPEKETETQKEIIVDQEVDTKEPEDISDIVFNEDDYAVYLGDGMVSGTKQEDFNHANLSLGSEVISLTDIPGCVLISAYDGIAEWVTEGLNVCSIRLTTIKENGIEKQSERIKFLKMHQKESYINIGKCIPIGTPYEFGKGLVDLQAIYGDLGYDPTCNKVSQVLCDTVIATPMGPGLYTLVYDFVRSEYSAQCVIQYDTNILIKFAIKSPTSEFYFIEYLNELFNNSFNAIGVGE